MSGDVLVPGEPRDLDRVITREELALLRAGRLDAERTVVWVKRTMGLAAPDPPAVGPLVPNETGYLLAESSLRHHLFPRLAHVTDRAGILAAVGPAMAHSWSLISDMDVSSAMMLGFGLAPWVSLYAGIRWLLRRRIARWRRGAATATSLADVPRGSLVRLIGVIPTTQAAVPSLFSGQPAVLFRSVLGQADETRGIDFELQPDERQRLTVEVRDAVLLDRPTRVKPPLACGPVGVDMAFTTGVARLQSRLFARPWLFAPMIGWAREASVGPGDCVEVTGVLDHEVDPTGIAAPGRSTPMRYRLRGDSDHPLLVRNLPGALTAAEKRAGRAQAVKPGRGPVPP